MTSERSSEPRDDHVHETREAVARILDQWAMDFNGYNGLARSRRIDALDKADAILALLSPLQGGVVVPVEPTEAILRAMAVASAGGDAGEIAAFFVGDERSETVAVLTDIYRAMLSARPQPLQGVEGLGAIPEPARLDPQAATPTPHSDGVPRDAQGRDAYQIIALANRDALRRRRGAPDRSREPRQGPPEDMAVSRVLLAERPDFDPKEADRLAVKIVDVLFAEAEK